MWSTPLTEVCDCEKNLYRAIALCTKLYQEVPKIKAAGFIAEIGDDDYRQRQELEISCST